MMAFHHLTGVTTPGAPDEIVDWFATFQAWITGVVGWIVVAGAGTTNLVIRSNGEAGGLLMLFAHIWRDAMNPTRIRMEVQDDAVGTHVTTEAGYLDSGGVQFQYWMSADLDAIHLAAKLGAGYRMVHGGLIMPFALTVPDETYCMVCAGDMWDARILRRHDGFWNQLDLMYQNPDLNDAVVDRDDGSYTPAGVMFGDNADIAGQFKHISCRFLNGPAPEDTITSGYAGATTEWVVLADHVGRKYALRTGGVLPAGTPDGAHFAHAAGIAGTIGLWFGALVAFMTGIGWTATDISGASGNTHDWEFNSAGESGLEDIWIRCMHTAAPSTAYFRVADSAFGTPGRHETAPGFGIGPGSVDFPQPYWFTGDLDCLLETTRNLAGQYKPNWQGIVSPCAPVLSSTYMKAMIAHDLGVVLNSRVLQQHDGVTWDSQVYTLQFADGPHASLCNPNNYDGTTYVVWPAIAFANVPPGFEPIGQLRYYFASDGGGLANLDTITVGARVYTCFFDTSGNEWLMRTV